MEGYHLIALSGRTSSFFDPVSRINLSLANPRGVYPVDRPLTSYLIAGLRQGILIDVYKTTELYVTPQPAKIEDITKQVADSAVASVDTTEVVIEPTVEATLLCAVDELDYEIQADVAVYTTTAEETNINSIAQETETAKHKHKRSRKPEKDGA